MRLGTETVLLMCSVLVCLGMVAFGFAVGRHLNPPVYCYAGSELLINAPEEIPVYELKCEGPIRVLILD